MSRIVTLFIICVLSLFLAGCKESVILFNSLDERQANPIMAVLLEHGIGCEKQPGEEGTWRLLVSNEEFAQAVQLCQERGLPHRIYRGVGESFQKTGMVSSPTEERIRFMDALSQDLARTISEIDGVVSARVHVVLPNNDPFAKNVLPSSAAVAIRHRSDCNLEDCIPQIKNLVMNAIEGVSYDKITVTLFRVAVQPSAGAEAEPSSMTERISDEMMQVLITVNAGLAIVLIALFGFGIWYFARKKKSVSKAETEAEAEATKE